MEQIYLDNNATTKLDPRVLEAMTVELAAPPSNPSSVHHFGREAASRLREARSQIANYLNVLPKELIFTSSGTEALNLALLGLKPKGTIITSAIEHAAVYNTLQTLDCPTIYLPVGKEGHIRSANLEEAIGPDTSLIILSTVNNETGIKNPIDEIAAIAETHNIPLIVDGVASLGKEPILIHKGVTAMAFSGHKIHGPKGIGLLFLRKGTKLEPQLIGGHQESAKRAGTENLAGIIGLAKAIDLLELPEATQKMERLRDLFESELKGQIPDLQINGEDSPRICNTSNITFPNIDGEELVIHLDQNGIAVSMGSACSSGALEPSRVLLEMGLSNEEARSSLRFSLSRFTTEKEIKQAARVIAELPIFSKPDAS